MKIKAVLSVVIVAAFLVGGGFFFHRIQKKLNASEQSVYASWGRLSSAYRAQSDLVPKYLGVIRGFIAQERESLEAVDSAAARVHRVRDGLEIVHDPKLFSDFQTAQDDLSGALSGFSNISEHYPELRASRAFLELYDEMDAVRVRIETERWAYNDTAKKFNAIVRRLPYRWFAKAWKLKSKQVFSNMAPARSAP